MPSPSVSLEPVVVVEVVPGGGGGVVGVVSVVVGGGGRHGSSGQGIGSVAAGSVSADGPTAVATAAPASARATRPSSAATSGKALPDMRIPPWASEWSRPWKPRLAAPSRARAKMARKRRRLVTNGRAADHHV
jgi:hypothetical protein